MALGNLWHMLLATATAPGTPRDIMAGVMTKAPPEPMKPESKPPTAPITSRARSLLTLISMNMMEISFITLSPAACLSRLISTFWFIFMSSGCIFSPMARMMSSLVSSFWKTMVRSAAFTSVIMPLSISLDGPSPAARAELANRDRGARANMRIINNFFIAGISPFAPRGYKFRLSRQAAQLSFRKAGVAELFFCFQTKGAQQVAGKGPVDEGKEECCPYRVHPAPAAHGEDLGDQLFVGEEQDVGGNRHRSESDGFQVGLAFYCRSRGFAGLLFCVFAQDLAGGVVFACLGKGDSRHVFVKGGDGHFFSLVDMKLVISYGCQALPDDPAYITTGQCRALNLAIMFSFALRQPAPSGSSTSNTTQRISR